jgi:FkbM family methyltransferase
MIQRVLLEGYGLLARSGVAEKRWFRPVFLFLYLLYKRLFEAREARHLAAFIPKGALVVDVGANVGFMTEVFAHMAGPSGCIIAIEPEERNFADLRRRTGGGRIPGRILLVHGVAAGERGTMRLALNPLHPADHKIADEGVPVAAVTLDQLLEELEPLPKLALVKIDVQGAEMMVLDGAADTLARRRPAFYVEVDDTALRAMGQGAAALLERLEVAGYAPHRLSSRGACRMTASEALALCATPPGYRDLLFLPI